MPKTESHQLTYTCDRCGREFLESALATIMGKPEYSGGKAWPVSVSPCCHADYTEKVKTNMVEVWADAIDTAANGGPVFKPRTEELFNLHNLDRWHLDSVSALYDGKPIVVDGNQDYVCIVDATEDGEKPATERNFPNAALIVAAPYLKAACQAARAVGTTGQTHTPEQVSAMLDYALNMANAVSRG